MVMVRHRLWVGFWSLLGLLLLAGCPQESAKTQPSTTKAQEQKTPKRDQLKPPSLSGTLVVYSGRSKGLVRPLIRLFERQTGAKVEVKYGKTAQLALLLQEEAKQNKVGADVFWSQDAGALGVLEKVKLFQKLPEGDASRVPALFRNASQMWVATSGRARVVAYSSKKVKPEDLPDSVLGFANAKWKGRVGWAPTNASFQSFVTAMRVSMGGTQTKQWLQKMKANGAKTYPKNTAIIQAIASGEVDVGLPNHYYLLRFKKANKKFPVEQVFFKNGDIGNLVNVAGAGILKGAKNKAAAQRFIQFLLSPQVQQYITSELFEYPMIADVIANPRLVPLPTLLQKAPKLTLNRLHDLKGTLKLLSSVGLP